jgi:hypothetical protein
MTVVPFPPRIPGPARTVAQLEARTPGSRQPACDVTVEKDARTRRYSLLSEAPGHFVGDVWFGRVQHRRRRVVGLHDARMLRHQFARELRDLIADGWTEQEPR